MRVFALLAFPFLAAALFGYYLLFGVRSFEPRRNRVGSREELRTFLVEAYSFGADGASIALVDGSGTTISSWRKSIAGVDAVQLVRVDSRIEGLPPTFLGPRDEVVDALLRAHEAAGVLDYERGLWIVTSNITLTHRLGWSR